VFYAPFWAAMLSEGLVQREQQQCLLARLHPVVDRRTRGEVVNGHVVQETPSALPPTSQPAALGADHRPQQQQALVWLALAEVLAHDLHEANMSS
jgi:hypothetical protein